MITEFLQEVKDAINQLDKNDIAGIISIIRKTERLFIVGSGGSAGNASHAVCDFRKLCNIEAYTFENLSELTARINDDGWDNALTTWLIGSGFNKKDCLFILSVGGGTSRVSANIHSAIIHACNIGASVVGIAGRDNCTLTKYADISVVIRTSKYRTPIVEGLQSVLLHLIVTNLAKNKTIW